MAFGGGLDAEHHDRRDIDEIEQNRSAPLDIGAEQVSHLLLVQVLGDEADPGEIQDAERDDRGSIAFEECRHAG